MLRCRLLCGEVGAGLAYNNSRRATILRCWRVIRAKRAAHSRLQRAGGNNSSGGALSLRQEMAEPAVHLVADEASAAAGRFSDQLIAVLPRLRRFARGLTGSAVEADDLVQAACERALARRHQFQEGTRFDSWMFRIVQTSWIDQLRAREVRKEDGEIELERLGSDEPVRRDRSAPGAGRGAPRGRPAAAGSAGGAVVGDGGRVELSGGGRGGRSAGRDDHEPVGARPDRAAAPARSGRRAGRSRTDAEAR